MLAELYCGSLLRPRCNEEQNVPAPFGVMLELRHQKPKKETVALRRHRMYKKEVQYVVQSSIDSAEALPDFYLYVYISQFLKCSVFCKSIYNIRSTIYLVVSMTSMKSIADENSLKDFGL